MSTLDWDATLSETSTPGAVKMYCMASMVADEASRSGFNDLARSIEGAISGFLSRLPRDEQKRALQMSYEMATVSAGVDPATPRIRLAYSRD